MSSIPRLVPLMKSKLIESVLCSKRTGSACTGLFRNVGNEAPNSTRSRRSFSVAALGDVDSLCKPAKNNFKRLCRLEVPEVRAEISYNYVKHQLMNLDPKAVNGGLYKNWVKLSEILLTKANIQLPSLSEGELPSQDHLESLFSIRRRPLYKSGKSTSKFTESDYIYSATEHQWSDQPLILPFPYDQRLLTVGISRIDHVVRQMNEATRLAHFQKAPLLEDQQIADEILSFSETDTAAAFLLALPYLNSSTVVHDIGTAHGQNLFNLLFYSHFKGREVRGGIGTDVNRYWLNLADGVSMTLGLHGSRVQFHLANALDPFDIESLGFQGEAVIKLALRLLPQMSLDSGKRFLGLVRDSISHPNSACILSYALPEGKNWQNSESHFKGDSSVEGVTVFDYDSPRYGQLSHLKDSDRKVIFQTYYSQSAFELLVKQSGLRIIDRVVVREHTDNHREVVVLKSTSVA